MEAKLVSVTITFFKSKPVHLLFRVSVNFYWWPSKTRFNCSFLLTGRSDKSRNHFSTVRLDLSLTWTLRWKDESVMFWNVNSSSRNLVKKTYLARKSRQDWLSKNIKKLLTLKTLVKSLKNKKRRKKGLWYCKKGGHALCILRALLQQCWSLAHHFWLKCCFLAHHTVTILLLSSNLKSGKYYDFVSDCHMEAGVVETANKQMNWIET